MIINLDRSGSIEGFRDIIEKTGGAQGVEALMVLACDANGFTPGNIDGLLKNRAPAVFGGIFPEIMYGNEKLSKGTIVAGISKRPNVQIIRALSDLSIDYEQKIDESVLDITSVKTVFVFVDGFSKRISDFVESLFNVFGLVVNYIGGGAGSISMSQKPCLITNDGLLKDAAVLAFADMESGVGVSHGWNKVVGGPFLVTESDRNIVKMLDRMPAFDLYRQYVEEHSGFKFSDNNFFEISKRYPLGISRIEAEYIVRDPFKLGDAGSLICVGEVPEVSFVSILNGDISSLIDAARSALSFGKKSFAQGKAHRTTFFMDCISRALFLAGDFRKELEAVVETDVPLIGALTVGEIAGNGKNFLEFYNKTAVVGILED